MTRAVLSLFLRRFSRGLRSSAPIWLCLAYLAMATGRGAAATPPIADDGGDSRAQSINVGRGAQTTGPAKQGEGSIAGINIATGNKLTTIPLVGWACRGGMSIGFSLYHNSRGDLNEPFAAKWRYSYESYIVRSSGTNGGTATIHWDDGSGVTFDDNFDAPPGEFGLLSISPTTVSNSFDTVSAYYIYTSKDQITYGFDNAHGNYLTFIEDRNGNVITIDRQSSYPWNVTTVTDPTGRQLRLNWNSSNQVTLTDPLYRQWSFDLGGSQILDDNGIWVNNVLLNGVTLPPVALYNSSGTSNLSYAFDYTSSRYNSPLPGGGPVPDGDITALTNPGSGVSRFGYTDAVEDVLTDVTDPIGNHSNILYNNLQVTSTDPNGRQSTQYYNSSAILDHVVDPMGVTVGTYTFDTNFNLSRFVDARSLTWQYSYTPSTGINLTQVTNPDSAFTSISYTSLNDPQTITDPLQHSSTIDYTNGNAAGVVDANHNFWPITVPPGAYGMPSSVADPFQNTTSFQYDNYGNVNYVVDGNGIQHWFTYNVMNWLQSDSDALGNVTAYTYDNWGRLTQVRKGGSAQVPIYRLDGAPGCSTGGNCCDDQNRMYTADTNFQGNLSAGGWITDGAIGYVYMSPQAQPGLVAMHRLYQGSGAVTGQEVYSADTAQTNLLGSFESAGYSDQGIVGYVFPSQNAQGNLLPLYWAYNLSTSRYLYTDEYSEYANLQSPWQQKGVLCYFQSQSGSLVTTATYGYDANSNVVAALDGNSNGVTMTYDADNRLLTRTNTRALSGGGGQNDTVTYTYDQPNPQTGDSQKGLLTQVENGNNGRTFWLYDADNRVTDVCHPDGTWDHYGINPDSSLAWHQDGNGVTTSFAYDNEGRLAEVIHPTNGPKGDSPVFATTNTFSYDAAGRMTGSYDMIGSSAYGYDSAGRLTSITAPNGWIQYGYYANNLLHTKQVSNVGTWTYAYSGLGPSNPGTLPYTVTNPYGETTTAWYDAAGRLSTKILGNGQSAFRYYDDQSRLTSLQYQGTNAAGSPFAEFDYTYDAGGRIVSKLRGADNQLSTYSYDGANQLTEWKAYHQNQALLTDETFSYDHNGNRLTRTINGVTDTFTYDAADKLLSVSGGILGSRQYAYDNDGQRTGMALGGQFAASFDYDYDGNMVDWGSYTGGNNLALLDTYRYNGFGLQIERSDTTGSYTNINDGVGPGSPLLADGNAVYSGGDSMRVGTTSTYFDGDILGSVEDVSTSGGAATLVAEYDPFGVIGAGSGSAVGSPFQYCGAAGYQTSPDSGMMLLGNRWYDPAIGRFLTRDPSGAGDNPYAYCGNNPVSNLDPTGLQEGSANPPNGGGGDSQDFSGVLSNAWNWLKNTIGIGGGHSASKPTQGPAGFIDRLTHGPYGGGAYGIANNLFDASTYNLGYIGALHGVQWTWQDIGIAASVAGQITMAIESGGVVPAAEAVGSELAINVSGEGEIPGVLNIQGPWIETPGWRSSDRSLSFEELKDEGHQFMIIPRMDQLPFETGAVDTVYTNNVRLDGPPSGLGPYPSRPEIWRVLNPAGNWWHDGVLQTRP